MDFHAEELTLLKKGTFVIGVDEVGRGALAGPICAVASVITPTEYLSILDRPRNVTICDSKQTTRQQRDVSFDWLNNKTASFYVSIPVTTINEEGIQIANKLALEGALSQALDFLVGEKTAAFVDHFKMSEMLHKRTKLQIFPKADSLCMSTAIASIIAKTRRDRYMEELAKKHNLYGWEQNAGYGTLQHRTAIRQHGPTVEHRTDFIRKLFLS